MCQARSRTPLPPAGLPAGALRAWGVERVGVVLVRAHQEDEQQVQRGRGQRPREEHLGVRGHLARVAVAARVRSQV